MLGNELLEVLGIRTIPSLLFSFSIVLLWFSFAEPQQNCILRLRLLPRLKSGVSGAKKIYDPNGNLTDNGTFLLAYDFNNRLIEVKAKADNKLVAQYFYDAFNRRISKKTYEEVEVSQGEYKTDGNTLALYHFNEAFVEQRYKKQRFGGVL
ncbi:MAG: hypothetical protein HY808_03680 [Nitrospirae bacterium]|nr:hypothetical protein [Nitrospirota bacterium]